MLTYIIYNTLNSINLHLILNYNLHRFWLKKKTDWLLLLRPSIMMSPLYQEGHFYVLQMATSIQTEVLKVQPIVYYIIYWKDFM